MLLSPPPLTLPLFAFFLPLPPSSIPVPVWFTSALKNTRISSSSGAITPTAAAGSVDAKLKAGLYGVVRSLLRVLEKGVIGKAILDTVLDACSAMQVGVWVVWVSVCVCVGGGAVVVGPVVLCVGRGGRGRWMWVWQ